MKNKSLERRTKQKEELRSAILQAATELFLRDGYEKFSLRRVAESVGYSATTIYLYFRDKDDLLFAAVSDGFSSFDARMREVAMSVEEPLERLKALGEAYITWGLENPELYRLMFMQRADFSLLPRLDDKAEALLGSPDEDVNSPARQALVSAVKVAMEAGVLRPASPLVVADVLWSGAHGLVALALSPLISREHAQSVIQPLLRVLIDGVRATPQNP